ncbi:LysR family transcriptional regulator [Orrella sp. NBD-18]|uniref:LysR family transcriptional regulator n=1 Tax=Sheuella amnicola TaxID=2707330 RepID=A0A6B2QY79_9BURK|nr:LysR family transcriptional regulator [Sheuella amnicola]NDY82932.1 LysR family transcriptional regulator [Sheuella amnicola]
MRYELTDLRLFLAIAEAQSLTVGANHVHLTASSASYRLKNLESAMGMPLFVRTSRGMELTPGGQVVLQHVRSTLAGLERMHGEVGGFTSGLKGSVRLFANSSSLNGFIVPSLSRFLSAHPSVNVVLEEKTSQTILSAVVAQEADIGIFAGQTESTDVTAHRYAIDELILVAPVNHPIAAHQSLRFAAALELDFVCMSKASSNYAFLQEISQKLGRSPNVRIHAHTFDALLNLVADGVGVALVPRSVTVDAIRANRVAEVILRETWARRELTLITKAGIQLSAYVESVAQYLLTDPIVVSTRG